MTEPTTQRDPNNLHIENELEGLVTDVKRPIHEVVGVKDNRVEVLSYTYEPDKVKEYLKTADMQDWDIVFVRPAHKRPSIHAFLFRIPE